MPSRHASEPFAPISSNIVPTRLSSASTKPHVYGIENAMDGRVQDDFTIHSEVSNLTSLDEQTTDDFGKLLLQHARDEQRMQDALQGRARPFSKARPRQRGRLTLADLERSLVEKEQSFEERRRERDTSFLSFADSPPASVSSGESRGSEPSLNIPREWGRKARKGTDWLRRSLDRHDAVEAEDVIVRRATAFTGDGTPRAIDWANAASDVPLPTTEESPSALRYARGTPPSVLKRDEAAAASKQWNIDDDFTSASIIASTPALPRNSRLDDIKLRELEPVAEVSTLSRSGRQSSEGISSPIQQSVSRSVERRRERADAQQPSGSWSHPAEQELHVLKREQMHGPSVKRDIGPTSRRQDSSSPVVVYKSSETPRELRQRPQLHTRTDSHDLLRRLARAASGSPSPQRPTTDRSSSGPQASRSDLPAPSLTVTPAPDDQSALTESKAALSHAVKDAAESADNTAQGDAIDPHTPMPDELLDDTVEDLPRHAKTPIVTGAWVDTPAPASGKRTSFSPRKSRFSPRKSQTAGQTVSQSPTKRREQPQALPTPEASTSPQPRRSPQKPSLPPSALAAVLDDAKSHPNSTEGGLPYEQDLNHFGDSTINSLEDLVDTSLAAPSADDTLTMDLTGLPPHDAKPKNAAERQRWKEMEQVARMNKQLRDARHNIRDARVGLRRFENAMLSNDADTQAVQGKVEGCDTCGCPGGTVVSVLDARSIAHSLVYAFVVPSTSSSALAAPQQSKKFFWPWRWRLTWLGLILFSLLSYTVLETALCSQYCQPRYATSMSGYGVDLNAPHLPFVTPTLLSRPLQPLVQPLYRTIKTNGATALRAYGLLPETSARENLPWLRGRPTLSAKEKQAWESMIAAAKRTAAPDITRWAQRIATAMGEPASTALGWARTAATAALQDVEEVLGMGADEVL